VKERSDASPLAISCDGTPTEIVDMVIARACALGVSDIHFEPTRSGLDVRFRLDGVLKTLGHVARERSANTVSRLKVLAGLATYRTDVPQDGRFTVGEAAGGVDARLSTYPTVRGEKAVVRLFGARPKDYTLDRLGFPSDVTTALRASLALREGMIVLTGPAGSGKSTTLYACVQHARDEAGGGRSIVTIEDPAECLIPGVTQTEINPPAGLTFATCLRSMLRQDPEVIMVGEVRDRETAALALEAALTGHLVLTTLHAGTTWGVFVRLLEMGIEAHLITSAVKMTVAQRLVRRLCPDCKVEADGGWSAPGCEACLGTGYRGRVVIASTLAPTTEVRGAILARADAHTLEECAFAAGAVPLAARADDVVRDGVTSRDEVRRALAGVGWEGSGPRE